MLINCKNCGLKLGETDQADGTAPVQIICIYCIEEREHFRAYFGNEIRPKSSWSINENEQFDRVRDVQDTKDKIEDIYFNGHVVLLEKKELENA
jgi:hypothetical protein